MQLIIVSGRSGSGKSSALNALEDAGYCCIDNLPARFLRDLVNNHRNDLNLKGLAVSIDVRNLGTDLKMIPDLVRGLEGEIAQCRILYLDASTDRLVKRFSETRRKHPLTDKDTTLAEALKKEKNLLRDISEVADITVQTDDLNHYDLTQVLQDRLGLDQDRQEQLLIQSFGFKYGVPVNADYIFDVRCLPNPHWIPGLSPKTGLDQDVIHYLDNQTEVQEMLTSIEAFLNPWLDRIFSGNRSYLCVAIGCTGGKHRSVFLAEKLFNLYLGRFPQVQVRHRELS